MAMDMKSLREWCDHYSDSYKYPASQLDSLIQAVLMDDLDVRSIEQRVQEAMPGINIENGFCNQCHHLFDNWPVRNFTKAEHEAINKAAEESEDLLDDRRGVVARSCNTVEIEASTRRGCKFCAYILQALKDEGVLNMYRRIESRLRRLGESSTVSLSIGTTWADRFELWLDLPNKTTSCYCYENGQASLGFGTVINETENYADQPLEPLDQAVEWLRTCSASHQCCNDITEAYLPTRLVSLVEGKPRLVITKDLKPHLSQLQYAALSYCWGKNPFIKLTTDNMDAFKEGIPTEAIPKTFTDAFEIASKLAINFIWIDSLCIVQNDEGDWQRESERMHMIYNSSYVTISASSATDVHQGCFLTPDLFCGGVSTQVKMNGRQELTEFCMEQVYKRAVLSAHLLTRAWAIQEKVLSPRTLHFGNRGVVWECKKGFLTEHLPKKLRSEGDELVGSNDVSEPYFWHTIVRVYSAANLTYRRDKLRALAGIAHTVFNQTGDEYLSGIWKKDIELHLCWRTVGHRITQERANYQDRDWIAPSWSWASIDGGVTYTCSDDWPTLDDITSKPQRYGHVCELGISHSENRDFGQSICTMLNMRCSGLVLGRLCDRTTVSSDSSEANDSVVINHNDHDTEFPINVDCINDSSSLHDKFVYLLPLAGGATGTRRREHEQDWIDEKYISGLVLSKTASGLGEFCRIGSFKFLENASSDLGDDGENRQPFLNIFNKVGAITAETVCAEMVHDPEHPEERFLITIV